MRDKYESDNDLNPTKKLHQRRGSRCSPEEKQRRKQVIARRKADKQRKQKRR